MDVYLVDRATHYGMMDVQIVEVTDDTMHLLAIGTMAELAQVLERIEAEGGYLAGEPDKWLREIRSAKP